MNKLASFEQFSNKKARESKAIIREEQEAKRIDSANTFKTLLSEYGVAAVQELTEEQRTEFFEKLRGQAVSESFVNEEIKVSSKRAANKVFNVYTKIFTEATLLTKDKDTHMASIRELFFLAMEDANFNKEAYQLLKIFKAPTKFKTTTINSVELGNFAVQVGPQTINAYLNSVYHRISGAGDFAGITIVEGTALYLDSIGYTAEAQMVLDGFNAMFNESKVNEAKIKSDEEFTEYAMTVLKKAFGADFDEAKAQEVADGILGKCDGDYGACVGMLTSSLGESVVTEALTARKPNEVETVEVDMAYEDGDLKDVKAIWKQFNLKVKDLKGAHSLFMSKHEVTGKKKDILAYLQSEFYEMDAEAIEEYYPELLEGKGIVTEALKARKPNDVETIEVDMAYEDEDLKDVKAIWKQFNLKVKDLKGEQGEHEVTGKKKDILAYLQSEFYEMDAETIEEYYPELLEGKGIVTENIDVDYWADYNTDTSGQGKKEHEVKSKDFEDTFEDAVVYWNQEADGAENRIKGAQIQKIKKLAQEFFKKAGYISINITHAMIAQES